MQYGLRTNIHPDTWRSFLPELIRFCHEAHIDEVLLSEESYHIATVVQSEDFFHRVADAYCEIVPILKAEGLIPSMYIKVSMGHYEGYVEDMPSFLRFVGDNLQPSPAAPCGMDPAWQRYISRVCADCARAGFARLYLDDDFRSDNHFQGRAGCFCDLHVQATSRRCGAELTPETLRAHVCGNSPDDLRIRQAWMDVNFENQLHTGRMVEQAVHAVDPNVQIGLMCCSNASSSYQGRDLPRLLQTFAGEGRTLLVLFDPCEGALAASHFIDCAKKPFATAVWLYENEFGARICTFASAIVPDRNWLYKCRTGQVRAIVQWLLREKPTWAVSGGLNVMPIVLRGEADTLVALLNPSLDDAEDVQLDAPGSVYDAFSDEPLAELSVPAMSLRYVKVQ